MKPLPILFALAAVSPAFAHDTWIAPDQFGRCGAVTLHMTSAPEFGPPETAIEPSRVARAIMATPGRRINMTPVAAKRSLDFDVNVPENGMSIVAVELAPKTIDLTPAQVREYLDEIGASDDIRAQWKAHPGRWRETYTKHAKTFIRCGGHADPYLSTDMGFEMIPQGTDPTALKAGDKMRVVLVAPKQPPLVVPIVVEREGAGRVATVMPGKDRIADITFDRPGRYMLSATWLRRANGDDADWVSDFTTLTFDVK
jgi:hypothetical protein